MAKLEMGSVDRMSELPEFILHLILSFLDTKEACRVTVLSKYWYVAWCSIPVLDFRPLYFANPIQYGDEDEDEDEDEVEYLYDDEAGKRLIEYIDKTMQRYFEQKHRISKLDLQLPKVNTDIQHLVDKWIGIAVHNHVEELTLTIPYSILSYRLPEIICSAKSLKVLDCGDAGLPYYEKMDLCSLESLTLMPEKVDRDMLQRIVTFCPLIHLNVTKGGLAGISLPWVEKGFETTRGFGGGRVQSDVKTSLLRSFVYCGEGYPLWSWNINVGALRNLRTVEIIAAGITDDVVFQLASGLVALECLVLSSCRLLQSIQISSNSLKEFHIRNYIYLKKVTIDAPNLLEFGYEGRVETIVSLIRVQDCCNAHFLPWLDLDNIDTFWFVMLKKFLMESNIFRLLVIDFPKGSSGEIDVEELKNSSTCAPYKLRELKLQQLRLSAESTLINALDGLFWSCHPDVLSITTGFHSRKAKRTELVLNFLKDKVQCRNHPLKSIEVEGADLSSLLTRKAEIEIRFRLSWKTV